VVDVLEWAVAQAREAGEIAQKYFRQGFEIERKSDNSPVTIADKQIEEFLRKRIGAEFPNDGILGEEFDEKLGSGNRWVIDPIDGTKSFVYGVSLFSILIGLEVDGEPALGVAHFPALGETYWGDDRGAFLNGDRIRVSDKVNLADSLLLMGSLKAMDANGRLDACTQLARRAYATRNWGDAYGHCLVARGDAEAMFDPFVAVWDTCAVSAIVTAAGGRFTDFAGNPGHEHGEVVACAPGIFDEVIAAFER
jgi:histidinol phosphatase-like enzyme (inositol monophosphatase family)